MIAPQPGASISADGHTAVIQAGAAADSNTMVRAADDLKPSLDRLQARGIQVSLTGASGMWSDFNTANRTAMMKSELISWPVTLAILVLAFGSLVAAGLPLMLTIIGLMASAGSLYLGTQVLDISIWAMNFALMFALALGIDYALFIVYRFRGALFGSHEPVEHAVAETMDTAGKAVLFSGLTVLISLMAVMLVPSPAFRSMALGIMISVVFILAATLTLLPAVLGKLGRRVDELVAAVGTSGRAPLGAVRRLGQAPVAPPVRLWRGCAVVLRRARRARARAEDGDALDQGRPERRQLPRRLHAGPAGVRGGRARARSRSSPPRTEAARVAAIAGADPGVARVMPAMPGAAGAALVQAIPRPTRPARRPERR